MRRILCSAIFFSIVALAFAQIDETAPASSPAEDMAPAEGLMPPSAAIDVNRITMPLPPLLIHVGSNDFIRFSILGGDGHVLSRKELRSLLTTVPENVQLVKQGDALVAGM